MPGLKTVRPEKAANSPTRRRVWKHPELKTHSLLVLTPDTLHLEPLAGEPKAEKLAAVEAGADLDSILSPLTTVIDLIAVRRVRLDLLANMLSLDYLSSGIGTTRISVIFTTPEDADACFTKLWRRLGEGFALEPFRRHWWDAARTPLMLLVGVLAATATLALMLSIFEDFAAARAVGGTTIAATGGLAGTTNLPKSPLEWLIDWLDWRVVCWVGGAISAGLQVWLYRRLTQPPVSLELTRN